MTYVDSNDPKARHTSLPLPLEYDLPEDGVSVFWDDWVYRT